MCGLRGHRSTSRDALLLDLSCDCLNKLNLFGCNKCYHDFGSYSDISVTISVFLHFGHRLIYRTGIVSALSRNLISSSFFSTKIG